MRIRLHSIAKVLLAAVVLLAGFSSLAYAQNTSSPRESITLSPAVNKPVTNAGATVNEKLTIVNDGETDYRFLLYARPFSVTSEQYDPNFTEVNERTEAYQWVQFERTDLSIKAGETIEVPYILTVPQNAAPGGHYAVLFAETQPPESEGTQVARKKRVGSLLYITVNGDLKQSGSIESWKANFWQKARPLNAEVRIKNDGNVHYQASVQATYSNIFGKARFHLNQEQLILPGTTRRVETPWQNAPYLGIFKVSGQVNYLDKTEALPTKWVILLPMPIIAGVGVIILLAAVGAIVRSKTAKRTPKTSLRGKKK